MGKAEWKKTGKELGGAFSGLAKSLIRTAKTGVDKANDWAESDANQPQVQEAQQEEQTVFNDGTWRKTGKDLGHAFKDLGKTLVGTGGEVVDKVDDAFDGDDNQANKQA